MKLLIRPAPFREESLQQYILRLAKSNGYTNNSIAKLIKQVGGIPTYTNKTCHRDKLKTTIIRLTGHSEVQTLFDHRLWYENYREIFNYDRVKVCFQCLLENKSCYFHWHFRHVLTCEKHKTLLIDTCWLCKRLFSEFSFTSMTCEFCCVDILRENRSNTTIDNRVNNYFSSCNDLDELFDKIDTLKPYFELYQEKSYQIWVTNRLYSLKDRFSLINGVLDIFDNKQLTMNAFEQLITNNKNCRSISSATISIKGFLSHDKYPEFTSLFAEYLLAISTHFLSMCIHISFVDKLYKVNVMKAKDKSELEELGMLFCRQGIYVIYLYKLVDLLKICGYKFS